MQGLSQAALTRLPKSKQLSPTHRKEERLTPAPKFKKNDMENIALCLPNSPHGKGTSPKPLPKLKRKNQTRPSSVTLQLIDQQAHPLFDEDFPAHQSTGVGNQPGRKTPPIHFFAPNVGRKDIANQTLFATNGS